MHDMNQPSKVRKGPFWFTFVFRLCDSGSALGSGHVVNLAASFSQPHPYLRACRARLLLYKNALAHSFLCSLVYDQVLVGLVALQRKYYNVLRSVVEFLVTRRALPDLAV